MSAAFYLLAVVFLALWVFAWYALAKFGAAHKEVLRLKAESIRGEILRIGTIEINHEEQMATLEGWTFQGGFTGYVVHGYRIFELQEMEKAEIDRVWQQAIAAVRP